MAARELNVRGKELLTVSRLRMVRENQGKAKTFGRLNLAAKDVAAISGLIESDTVTQEMYLEQLDEILEIGEEADRESLLNNTLGEPGQELMDLWADLDRGAVKEDEALAEADRAVRERQASGES